MEGRERESARVLLQRDTERDRALLEHFCEVTPEGRREDNAIVDLFQNWPEVCNGDTLECMIFGCGCFRSV